MPLLFLFIPLFFVYFDYYFVYFYYYFVTLLCFFGYISYIMYAIKVRAACIFVPYNHGLKAPIQLSEKGRSSLALARSGRFGLGIAPKKKLSRIFNSVFI